jgi:hypothetical protein
MTENRSSGHGYLGWSHPLARIANRHCRAHNRPGISGWTGGVGAVACGGCWERAIRDDERVVVEYGLTRQQGADIDVVDEIAIERACRGEQVRLTRVERSIAAVQLRDCLGLTNYQIARRLHINSELVRQALALAEATAATNDLSQVA